MKKNFDLQKLARKNILALKPYSSARDEFAGTAGIFLDANENPYGDMNRYPDPHQKKLKTEIAELKNIPEENIFLGNGSDEAIDVIFRVFCNPGKDKVLIFTPTYGMYEVSAHINDVDVVAFSLNSDFQIDINDELQLHLKDEDIKLVFICSPNNPTGNLLHTPAIETILNNFHGMVILDEAYIDFAESESFSGKISEFPNLIVLQTFSKCWGLASARVGMCFAGKDIIGLMNKVKPPYNISTPNQEKVLERLQQKHSIEKELKIILEEKKMLANELSLLHYIQKIYPSDANFLLVRCDDALALYNFLVSKEIIIRNRNAVIENCIRITVGSPAENKALLNVMKTFKK